MSIKQGNNTIAGSANPFSTKDIAEYPDKRFITDAQQTIINNTSNTNTGDETATTIRTKVGKSNPLNQTLMKVKLTADQSILANTSTKINFNAVDFDTESIWNNTNKWATIPRTGYYFITTSITFQLLANSGYKAVKVLKNSDVIISKYSGFEDLNQQVVASDIVYLTAGDTILTQGFTRLLATPVIGSSQIVTLTIKEL